MNDLLNDFSSMKLCNGAFQIGPFKKQISESKTQELSSFSIVVRCALGWIQSIAYNNYVRVNDLK